MSKLDLNVRRLVLVRLTLANGEGMMTREFERVECTLGAQHPFLSNQMRMYHWQDYNETSEWTKMAMCVTCAQCIGTPHVRLDAPSN